jgi:hypothetical protein
MQKKTLAGAAAIAFFSIWATPAMAQTFDGRGGFNGPPIENSFVVPREMGFGCSRSRPRECTPDQRDSYNELVQLLCTLGGGTVGVVDGVIVTAAVAASVWAAPAAPVAGAVHGGAVGAAAITACYARFKIPNG